MKTFTPQVLVDGNGRPLIVFAKGRMLYHAIAARHTDITIVTLQTLRGLRELQRNGEPVPAAALRVVLAEPGPSRSHQARAPSPARPHHP